jgi:hypothetical protein
MADGASLGGKYRWAAGGTAPPSVILTSGATKDLAGEKAIERRTAWRAVVPADDGLATVQATDAPSVTRRLRAFEILRFAQDDSLILPVIPRSEATRDLAEDCSRLGAVGGARDGRLRVGGRQILHFVQDDNRSDMKATSCV